MALTDHGQNTVYGENQTEQRKSDGAFYNYGVSYNVEHDIPHSFRSGERENKLEFSCVIPLHRKTTAYFPNAANIFYNIQILI